MRLKELFTVPAGQKVTEKHLRRVLISSICSILLCMACLASATWAWFTVSIQNTGNMIQIGSPEVTVTVEGAPFTSGETLPAGEHTLTINRAVNQDDLQKKMECFVVLTVQSNGETGIYKIAVSETASVTIKNNVGCQLNWEAAWFAPASADEISDGAITVTAEEGTDPSTEASKPSTDPSTEATTQSSEPATEETTPSSEPATEESTPSTPSEADPTDNGATEGSDPATETTAASTETQAAQ